MTKKPGIMLYFDLRNAIDDLSRAQLGELLVAMLAYGEDGEAPDFRDDPMLKLAWSFVKPRLDLDEEHYQQVAARRKRAAQIRWERANASDAWSECQ